MTTSVEMHVVVVVPMKLDDAGNVVEVEQPYTADENPFMCGEGETYVVETEHGIEGWRRSTDQEIDEAYDAVSALLFKREVE